MIVGIRRFRSKSNTVPILVEEMEVVEEYRYVGVHLDSRLDWNCKHLRPFIRRDITDCIT